MYAHTGGPLRDEWWMEDGDPDRPLVERARSELPYGSVAYTELMGKYSASVYRRAFAILRSESDAEEVAQDVFLAVFRHLPRFRFERPFSHWLSTVTLNACRMTLSRRASEQRRRAALEREAPAPQPEPDVFARAIVLELLDQIEPGTRVALLLRFCAPLIDLVAALFGVGSPARNRRTNDE